MDGMGSGLLLYLLLGLGGNGERRVGSVFIILFLFLNKDEFFFSYGTHCDCGGTVHVN